jgi:hypothetical protein
VAGHAVRDNLAKGWDVSPPREQDRTRRPRIREPLSGAVQSPYICGTTARRGLMDLPDYDEETQSFDPAEHPDNLPLDEPVPAARTEGEPIPEDVDVEDDADLAGVDLDDITPGPGEEEDES